MQIDNHIGKRVRMRDDYFKEPRLGYAFPTIGCEYSFLFVADEPDEMFHNGSVIVDEYPMGFLYENRCWWVSQSKLEDIPNKLLL